jgi:hypothetical protein
MHEDGQLAQAFAAGMAVVALEDAFIDLVELLLRDETLPLVEVQALRHLHLARFDVVQGAGKWPEAYAQAIEERRQRLEISWERKLGKA